MFFSNLSSFVCIIYRHGKGKMVFAPQSAGEAAEQYEGDWVNGTMLGKGAQQKHTVETSSFCCPL